MSSSIQTLTLIVLSLALLLSFVFVNTAPVGVCTLDETGATACTDNSHQLFIDEVENVLKADYPPESNLYPMLLSVLFLDAITPELFDNIRAQGDALFDNIDAFLNDIFVCTHGPADDFIHMLKENDMRMIISSRFFEFVEKHLPSIEACARNSGHLTKFISVSTFDKIASMARACYGSFLKSKEYEKEKNKPVSSTNLDFILPYLPYYQIAERVPFCFFVLTFVKVSRAQVIGMIPQMIAIVENIISIAPKLKAAIKANDKSECITQAAALARAFHEREHITYANLCSGITV